jgi:hypothetical protein
VVLIPDLNALLDLANVFVCLDLHNKHILQKLVFHINYHVDFRTYRAANNESVLYLSNRTSTSLESLNTFSGRYT